MFAGIRVKPCQIRLQKYDCTDKIRTQLYQRRTSAKFQPPFGHRNKVEMNFKKTLRCFR